MKSLGNVVALIMWIAGWIIAQGFWSTFFAVIIPLWGYYLVVREILRATGLI